MVSGSRNLSWSIYGLNESSESNYMGYVEFRTKITFFLRQSNNICFRKRSPRVWLIVWLPSSFISCLYEIWVETSKRLYIFTCQASPRVWKIDVFIPPNCLFASVTFSLIPNMDDHFTIEPKYWLSSANIYQYTRYDHYKLLSHCMEIIFRQETWRG